MTGLVAPAADRNKGPILDVLQRFLPPAGTVLEIASGTGQHVVHFARAITGVTWIPTDVSAEARRSIEAWRATEQLPNVQSPLNLDARRRPWPVTGSCDAIVCINLIHISPWAVTRGLFEGAAATLVDGGLVYLYGPYKQHGRHTAPSNEAFDRSLRAQDPEWGVRDLEDVVHTAQDAGFEHIATVNMPANNLSVIFRRNAALPPTSASTRRGSSE
jgi:cyclopropane fatty-acyl-phospholipid synthase-like methyltransferase